jgi:hypothetical protein
MDEKETNQGKPGYQAVFQENTDFSYEGYQVVRREFFAHTLEPALTIRGDSIVFNTACIRKCENVVYVQLLVSQGQRKLVIRPCGQDDKDAIRWCIADGGDRRTRTIRSDIFSGMLYGMMGWDMNYRYKLQGTTFAFQGQPMYLFDLTATEVYMRQGKPGSGDGKVGYSRKACYPEEWKDTFGLPVAEHREYTKIDLFDGYITFSGTEDKKQPAARESMPAGKPEESAVTSDV